MEVCIQTRLHMRQIKKFGGLARVDMSGKLRFIVEAAVEDARFVMVTNC